MKQNTAKNSDKNPDPEQWVDTVAACAHLSISKPTIYRWVKRKLLKPKRTPGGELRYRRSDLDKMLD